MRVFSAVMLVFSMGWGQTAVAQTPSGVLFRWDTPMGCPDTTTLTRAVNTALSRQAFVEQNPAFVLAGHLSIVGADEQSVGGATSFIATLVLSTVTGQDIGERVLSLQSADCTNTLAPLTLVLALLLDLSEQHIALTIPAPLPDREQEVASEHVPIFPPPDVSSTLDTILSVGAGVTHGLVPSTVPFVELGVGVRYQSWTVGLWILATLEGTAELVGTDYQGAAVSAWSGLGGVNVCAAPLQHEAWLSELCVDIGAGWTAARGKGLPGTRGFGEGFDLNDSL